MSQRAPLHSPVTWQQSKKLEQKSPTIGEIKGVRFVFDRPAMQFDVRRMRAANKRSSVRK